MNVCISGGGVGAVLLLSLLSFDEITKTLTINSALTYDAWLLPVHKNGCQAATTGGGGLIYLSMQQ